MTHIKAAVTFNNLTKYKGRLDSSMIHKFRPDPREKAQAIEVFKRYKLYVTSQSDLTLSIEGEKDGYEALFGTKLTKFDMLKPEQASEPSFWYPKQGEKWNYKHELKDVIDETYIQWPHYYAQDKPFVFPTLDYYHLKPPRDVANALNAEKVHQQGITGNKVKVVMLDSGFHFNHQYFVENEYDTNVFLGPGAINPEDDEHGHGTAMAANLLAVAPGVSFVGIKLANPDIKEKSSKLNQAFEEALRHDPNVISLSLTYDLTKRRSRRHLKELPLGNKGLEVPILEAIRKGITVVCASGNGHVGFPGMMEEVLSVGGVYIDEEGRTEASDFTSAFTSKIFSDRHVPDFCGLSGLYNNGDENNLNPVPGGLIMLPVQRKCKLDKDTRDNTPGNDGWTVEGGSSSATAQIAGVCALLLEKDPSLTPNQLKDILKTTSKNIENGKSNKSSNEGEVISASADQPDLAVGFGLVDAFEALKLVR